MAVNVTFIEDVSSLDLAVPYAELMTAAFGASATRWTEVFKCKHQESPFGGSYAGLVYDSGRLVAMNFFLRWSFSRASRVVRAAQSCDSAVHPDYRGRGLFSAIQKTVMDRIPKDVIRYGFPNSSSAPGMRKLGWAFPDVYVKHISAVKVPRFLRHRVLPRHHQFQLLSTGARPDPTALGLNDFLKVFKRQSEAWTTDYSTELIAWAVRLSKAIRVDMLMDDAEAEKVVGCIVYTISELVADASYRMLSIIDLMYFASKDTASAVRKQLRSLLDRHDISEIQSVTTKSFDVLAKLGWGVHSKSGTFIIHPSYGWSRDLSMDQFVADLKLTSFDSDHL